MKRSVFGILLVVVPVLIGAGVVVADDEPGFGPLPKRPDDVRQAPGTRSGSRPVSKKDPVEMAFALPRGMVLTPKEFAYAAQVRKQLEPQLRDALDRVQNSTDKSAQAKAIREVKQIKERIQAEINGILQARYVAAMKEAAKQEAARREAMRKRAAQQRSRNKGRGKKKRR